MKLAKGKYVAFIDADDLWMPNKLKQVAFMEKNKINITHTSYSIINERNLKTSFRKAKNLKFNDLIYSCDVGLSTVMIKNYSLKIFSLISKLKRTMFYG